MYSFLILGSDKRMAYLRDFISAKNCTAVLSDKLVSGFDYIVLPIPCTENGYIKGTDIKYTDLPKSARIFAGKAELLKGYENVFDYGATKSYKEQNGAITAVCAVKEAQKCYEAPLATAKILVCGYGYIGKPLAKKLSSLHADVTVSARKKSDFLYAEKENIKCVETSKTESLQSYDIVFNTVPFNIFTEKVLKTQKRGGVFIELASFPFGAREEDTKCINYVKALSLPGKYYPKSASKIIMNSIFSYLE